MKYLYLHTSMHTVTSDNERTEQNGKPHSNPSLVIASYGPAPNYYCEWIERLRHHDDWSRSTYSI